MVYKVYSGGVGGYYCFCKEQHKRLMLLFTTLKKLGNLEKVWSIKGA